MIYKLQRLFSDDNNAGNNDKNNNGKRNHRGGNRGRRNNRRDRGSEVRQDAQNTTTTPPASTTTTGQQPPKVETPRKNYTPMENERQYLNDLENGVNARDAKKGYEARQKNIKEVERQKKRIERLEKWDAKKAKFKQAKEKAGMWIKRNKKPLILAGSGLAVGTGAVIIGSKINKKNERKKIKESVRGYSDVED